MSKKEDSNDWVYDYIFGKISSPEFRNPIKNFIDENCSSFIDVDENTFQQGALFNEFTQLVDNLLEKILQDCNLTEEQFVLASKKGLDNEKHKKYFEQLISFNNYNYFKNMMTKRNYQFIKMAEEAMKKDKKVPEKLLATTKEQKELEEKQIQSAIKMSLALEDEKKRIKAIEDEELKRAIRLSQMDLANQKKNQPKTTQPIAKTTQSPPVRKEVPKTSNKSIPKPEEKKEKININLQSQIDSNIKGSVAPPPMGELKIESAQKGFGKQVDLLSSEFGLLTEDDKKKEKEKNNDKNKVISIEENIKNVNGTNKKIAVSTTNNNIQPHQGQDAFNGIPINSSLSKPTQLNPVSKPSQLTQQRRDNIKTDVKVEGPKVVQPKKETKSQPQDTTKINVASIKKEPVKIEEQKIDNKKEKDPLEQLMDEEFGSQEPNIEVSKGIKFSNFSANPQKVIPKEEPKKKEEPKPEPQKSIVNSITNSSKNNFIENNDVNGQLPKVKEKKLGKFFIQEIKEEKYKSQMGIDSVNIPVGSVIQDKDEDLMKKFAQIEQEKAAKLTEYRNKILQMKKEKRAEKENEAKLSQEEKIKLEQRKALAEKLKSNNKV